VDEFYESSEGEDFCVDVKKDWVGHGNVSINRDDDDDVGCRDRSGSWNGVKMKGISDDEAPPTTPDMVNANQPDEQRLRIRERRRVLYDVLYCKYR
jgi:hypothetical protein